MHASTWLEWSSKHEDRWKSSERLCTTKQKVAQCLGPVVPVGLEHWYQSYTDEMGIVTSVTGGTGF
jgi:hypothetical protein